MAENSGKKILIWDELGKFPKREKVEKSCKEFECPVCGYAMKVNFSFQVAKCFNCGYEFCWTDPVTRICSMLRLAEEIGIRKHGWKRKDVPSQRLFF